MILLHIFTNDLKSKAPEVIVEDLAALLTYAKPKHDNPQFLISLATPRNDNVEYHTKAQIINPLCKQKFRDDVHFVDHSNVGR